MNGIAHAVLQRIQSVQRLAEPVQNPAQELGSHRHGRGAPLHDEAAAWPDPLHVAERHQQHTIIAEAHDLGRNGPQAVLAGDFADFADGRERAGPFNDNPHRLGHTPRNGDRLDLIQPFSEFHRHPDGATLHRYGATVYPGSHRPGGSAYG